MRDDIQHILSGTSQVKHHHLIQTTCSYLKRSQGTSSMVKDQQQHKEEETKRLVQFAEENNLLDNIMIGGVSKNIGYTNWWDIFYNWDDAKRNKTKLYFLK